MLNFISGFALQYYGPVTVSATKLFQQEEQMLRRFTSSAKLQKLYQEHHLNTHQPHKAY